MPCAAPFWCKCEQSVHVHGLKLLPSNPGGLLCSLPCQAAELAALRAEADEAAAQQAALEAQLAAATAEAAAAASNAKKLAAERASLQEQLGSSTGDIDLLQVRAVCGTSTSHAWEWTVASAEGRVLQGCMTAAGGGHESDRRAHASLLGPACRRTRANKLLTAPAALPPCPAAYCCAEGAEQEGAAPGRAAGGAQRCCCSARRRAGPRVRAGQQGRGAGAGGGAGGGT